MPKYLEEAWMGNVPSRPGKDLGTIAPRMHDLETLTDRPRAANMASTSGIKRRSCGRCGKEKLESSINHRAHTARRGATKAGNSPREVHWAPSCSKQPARTRPNKANAGCWIYCGKVGRLNFGWGNEFLLVDTLKIRYCWYSLKIEEAHTYESGKRLLCLNQQFPCGHKSWDVGIAHSNPWIRSLVKIPVTICHYHYLSTCSILLAALCPGAAGDLRSTFWFKWIWRRQMCQLLTCFGWKKSCTTWDGRKPINNGINHLLDGAGFLLSTVWYWKT